MGMAEEEKEKEKEKEKEEGSNCKKGSLPVGFRFRPTDEELLVHYLRRKVHSLPLPASIVPDHLDLFRTHPSLLPGDINEKKYFFTRKGNVQQVDGLRGYWKVINGGGKKVMKASGSGSDQVIGLKRCLVFYQRCWSSNSFVKTSWNMHEFRVLDMQNSFSLVEMGDWLVCRIYQKKKKRYGYGLNHHRNGRKSQQLMAEDGCPSGGSGITEVSCNELDQEEASSCC